MTKPQKRLLQGILLGLGAPLGWAVATLVLGLSPGERGYKLLLYAYMTVGGIFAAGLFGFVLGLNEQRLSLLSSVDHLTGLANRRAFQRSLEQAFGNTRRYGDPLTILLLDLDHFKRVNDRYGHQAGDAALKAVASTVRGQVRIGDSVARVGGEEFAVLMPSTLMETGVQVAERIRLAVKAMPIMLPDGRTIHVNVSIGAAGTDTLSADNPKQLFALVDAALYRAKREGRDRVARAFALDQSSESNPDMAGKKS